MKHRSFFDINQAIMYLNDSVVRFDKKPVYIHRIEGVGPDKTRVTASYVSNISERIVIDLFDEKADLNPVPLGMINIPLSHGKSIVVSGFRIPCRRYKIGLSRYNFRFNFYPNDDIEYIPEISSVLFSQALENTVVNNYPSFKDALSWTDKKPGVMIAFSRRFAVTHNKFVLYKHFQTPIGIVKDEQVQPFDQYFYLSQAIEEDIR